MFGGGALSLHCRVSVGSTDGNVTGVGSVGGSLSSSGSIWWTLDPAERLVSGLSWLSTPSLPFPATAFYGRQTLYRAPDVGSFQKDVCRRIRYSCPRPGPRRPLFLAGEADAIGSGFRVHLASCPLGGNVAPEVT